MSDPPQRQKEDHQIAVEVLNLTDATAFDVPPSAFGVLKGGFDAHAPPIHLDELSSRRSVGNHHPHLFIAWFPTDRQRGGKAVLLPNQRPAVPLETFFGHKLSDGLPRGEASFEVTTHQMLLGNAQQVMPLHLLTDPDEFEATESAISQQSTIGGREKRGDLRKELAHQFPLPLLPLRLLRHDFPGEGQHSAMDHQAKIDDGKIVTVRSTIEHKDHLFVVPKRHNLRSK